jgi:hypothetical protein
MAELGFRLLQRKLREKEELGLLGLSTATVLFL